MAIIKCSECNKNVSDKASACPNCGNPISHKAVDAPSPPTETVVRHVHETVVSQVPPKKKKQVSTGCGCLILILLVVFIWMIFAAAGKKTTTSNPNEITQADDAASIRSKAEAIAAKRDAEVERIKNLPRIGSVQLARAFEDNEIAANNKYKGQELIISGTTTDISTNLTGSKPRITLKGTSIFQSVYADFKPREMEQAAKISKGASITIKGRVTGYTLGSVVVDNCTFFDENSPNKAIDQDNSAQSPSKRKSILKSLQEAD